MRTRGATRLHLVQTIALALLGTLGWLGGCSDGPTDPCPTCPPLPHGLIVSDPAPAGGGAAVAGRAAAPASSAGDSVAYVSLPPGTVPTGSWATLRRVGDAATVTDTVRDGGFDPVPVGARAGDSIEVIVRDAGGATVYQVRAEVRAARPPIVVRTDPPPRKRDVPLNASLVVVFSEPVAGGTLTPSSVQLLRGGSPVAGTVSLLQGTGAVAAFTPTAPLDRNADYSLVVTTAVRDLDGEALEAPVTVSFTTGQSSTGPAASITLSPDTVYMTTATYQMTATVRDAAGNQLIDQLITWSTSWSYSDPSGLTVSATGLLTAVAEGSYKVAAVVNGLKAEVLVFVRGGAPGWVVVLPTSATVGAGDTIVLRATVRDAAGRLLDHPLVGWTSSDVAVATAGPFDSRSFGLAFGTVTGVSPGSVTITATSGTARATASVMVIPPQPVASVTVIPGAATLLVQRTVQLSAALRDANGNGIHNRPVSWATDNAAVAAVDGSGVVTGVGVGSAVVTATSEGVSGTAAITVTAITFASLSAGWLHTCGITSTGAAYCWGDNANGYLGNGSTSPSAAPVAVAGGLTFSTIAAGAAQSCGVASVGSAYCWGWNGEGELGNGSTSRSTTPAAVAGSLSFRTVLAEDSHTCGLTTSGAAYCWGVSWGGWLGDGSSVDTTFFRLTPVAVTGGLSFISLAGSATSGATCGFTGNAAAYCWGVGGNAPVPVSGEPTFTSLSPGGTHICGLTATGAAYCWGANDFGALGDGSTTGSATPVAVAGALTFTSVTVGLFHTCGVTTSGQAYCWGLNQSGQLGTVSGMGLCAYGDFSYACSTTPVAVAGGLTFASVTAGRYHTCGVTVAGIAYCWGYNSYGQLGNGTTTNSSVPAKVAGQP